MGMSKDHLHIEVVGNICDPSADCVHPDIMSISQLPGLACVNMQCSSVILDATVPSYVGVDLSDQSPVGQRPVPSCRQGMLVLIGDKVQGSSPYPRYPAAVRRCP